MATKRTTQQQTPKNKEVKFCGTCCNCTPIYDQHTLTVKDKKPTMGKCPKITERCVLLSERACSDHNKELKIINEEEVGNE